MSTSLTAVGVREAKNRFSALAAQVNASGSPLTVLKNNTPWVIIAPADPESLERRKRLERFRALTALVEQDLAEEPVWDPAVPDRELLGRERVRRFG